MRLNLGNGLALYRSSLETASPKDKASEVDRGNAQAVNVLKSTDSQSWKLPVFKLDLIGACPLPRSGEIDLCSVQTLNRPSLEIASHYGLVTRAK